MPRCARTRARSLTRAQRNPRHLIEVRSIEAVIPVSHVPAGTPTRVYELKLVVRDGDVHVMRLDSEEKQTMWYSTLSKKHQYDAL